MNIIAVGGGRIYAGETKLIDSYAASLLHSENKLLAIIPTASKDRPDYIEAIKTEYQNLGVQVTVVKEGDLETNSFTHTMTQSAGVYIGGGDAEYLIEKIRYADIAGELIGFANKEKLVIGLSAGSAVLFEKAIFVKDERPVVINGLGIVDGVVVPHYDGKILEICKNEIESELNQGRNIYGLSDGSALHFTSKSDYAVIAESYSSGAWQISLESGIVGTRQITVR